MWLIDFLCSVTRETSQKLEYMGHYGSYLLRIIKNFFVDSNYHFKSGDSIINLQNVTTSSTKCQGKKGNFPVNDNHQFLFHILLPSKR